MLAVVYAHPPRGFLSLICVSQRKRQAFSSSKKQIYINPRGVQLWCSNYGACRLKEQHCIMFKNEKLITTLLLSTQGAYRCVFEACCEGCTTTTLELNRYLYCWHLKRTTTLAKIVLKGAFVWSDCVCLARHHEFTIKWFQYQIRICTEPMLLDGRQKGHGFRSHKIYKHSVTVSDSSRFGKIKTHASNSLSIELADAAKRSKKPILLNHGVEWMRVPFECMVAFDWPLYLTL